MASSFQSNFKVSIRCVVKGYQDCCFKVEKGEIFTAVKKIGDYRRAFKVIDSGERLRSTWTPSTRGRFSALALNIGTNLVS